MKFLLWIIGIGVVLAVAYLIGPAPEKPIFEAGLPTVNNDLKELEAQINTTEAAVPGIKADNEARIVWADSFAYTKSPYSLVYMHGFSASQAEGRPTHREFAKRYGCNLYLARLQSHGIEHENAMLDLSPEGFYETAKEALAIGRQIGEKVILMSTSTGGTLSLMLAADHPDIAGLILYSPNIDLFDPSSSLLIKPWGLQLARTIMGSDFREWEGDEETQKYWSTKYRIESLVALKAMVAATMTAETFQQVTQPVFLGYYYKNETEQDQVVSVPRMLEMFDQLGTPADLKRKVAFPTVGNHGLAGEIWSQDVQVVQQTTYQYAEEVLGLVPVSSLEQND